MRQTQHSENLNLALPEGGDAVEVAALRENFAALDAALGEQAAEIARALGTEGRPCRIAWGTYAGDGTYGADNPCVINTGFYPLFARVFITADPVRYFILMMRNTKYGCNEQNSYAYFPVDWSDDRISWYHTSYASSQGNALNTTYGYLVLGYEI